MELETLSIDALASLKMEIEELILNKCDLAKTIDDLHSFAIERDELYKKENSYKQKNKIVLELQKIGFSLVPYGEDRGCGFINYSIPKCEERGYYGVSWNSTDEEFYDSNISPEDLKNIKKIIEGQ